MSTQTETEIATISTDNPYVMMDNEDSENQTAVVTATVVSAFPSETRTIYINGLDHTCVEVPVEIANRALQIQSMSGGIKCICFVDLIFNLVYMLYGSILGFIFSLASASGIYSSYYQSRSLLTCYLCYQYIMVLSKLITIVFYIALVNHDIRDTFHENYPQIPLPETMAAPIFMSSFLFLIQTYIACYVRKYYNLLPNSDDKKYFVARALPVSV
jgi:hypothetical protein